MNPKTYVDLLQSGRTTTKPIKGLCGRLIRGKTPDDFRTLSNDPVRQLVLLIDSDGLNDLIGRSPYDMLKGIGYEDADIETEVKYNDNEFKLIVFPEGSAQLGTWDNVLNEAAAAYPKVVSLLEKNRAGLIGLEVGRQGGWDQHQKRFEELESRVGDTDWNTIRRRGDGDHGYMTTERFLRSSGSLADARAWCFFTLHLRRLYGGDGYTYEDNGTRGPREFVLRNMPVADLAGHVVFDLDVLLPVMAPVHGSGNQQTIHLVTIDPQFDFCNPAGALFVPGADQDMVRLSKFVRRATPLLADIHVTLDSHQRLHIAHPEFTVNAMGAHPDPFTIITHEDGKSGKYRAANPALQDHWLAYLKALDDNGRYPFCVWPPHCLIGTPGAAVSAEYMDALNHWVLKRFGVIDWLTKGSSWKTEHYSAVVADVPDPDDSTTQLNMRFIRPLEEADLLIWAGQASTHCVPNTYQDVANAFSDPGAITKMVLLEDCQSPPIAVDGTAGVPAAVGVTPRLRRPVAFWPAPGGWLIGYDLLNVQRLDPIRADAVTTSEDGLIHLHRGEDILEMRYVEGATLKAVPERIGTAAPRATHLFPGVAIQSLLGATYASLLPKAGRCVQVRLREIEDARLLDARFVGGRGKDGRTGVLVIAVERAGNIDVHTWSGLHAAGRFEQHAIEEDVGTPDINMVELDTGVCISVVGDGTINMFKPGSDKRRAVQDDSLANARLFADGGTLLAAFGDGLHRANMK